MSEQAASYNVTYTNKRDFNRAIQSEIVRLGKTPGTDYSGPQPSLVRALFEHTRWTQAHAASLLRVDVSTLRRWSANREQRQSREIPYSAWSLLLLLSGHASLASMQETDFSVR